MLPDGGFAPKALNAGIETGLGEARAGVAALSPIAVALIAAVPLEQALAVGDVAGFGLGRPVIRKSSAVAEIFHRGVLSTRLR
jgi:hypothetical protein